jgi:hypothetical protein
MDEKPSLNFEKPLFSYDELEQQLRGYQPDPDRYPHDVPSMISIEEGIRAGRMGNVAVGGCLLHHDEVICETSRRPCRLTTERIFTLRWCC